MTRSYHVPCPRGVEDALAGEIHALDAEQVTVRPGGVNFRGSIRLGYECCLWLRSAIRVQEQLARGEILSSKDLYHFSRTIPWERSITPDDTIAVSASGRHPAFNDLRYAALVVKDAICDRFREGTGRRPSVDKAQPHLPVKVHLSRSSVIIYRDLAGASLHKRGYRPIQVKSPLNEALAAGLLLLTDWDRQSPLVDPMCGSGTFVIEAALMASDRAPGLTRRFACESWADHDTDLMGDVRRSARERIKPELPFRLQGADRHGGAVSLARDGAQAAGVSRLVTLDAREAEFWEPVAVPSVVATNPPYGMRIGEGDDLVTSWQHLAKFLRERCSGASAWVLSGNPELTRHLRMRATRKFPVKNATIDCRWVHYEIR